MSCFRSRIFSGSPLNVLLVMVVYVGIVCLSFVFLVNRNSDLFNVNDTPQPAAIHGHIAEDLERVKKDLRAQPAVIEPEDPWFQEQRRRKRLLKEVCSTLTDVKFGFDELDGYDRKLFFYHMLVDDKHETLFCFIPKVGCTNWKRVSLVMGDIVSYDDPADPHLRNILKVPHTIKLQHFSLEKSLEKLKTYRKYFFVRHPFERILSGYRNKLEGKPSRELRFQNHVGRLMITNYVEGTSIPFPVFADYVLKYGKSVMRSAGDMNDHWGLFVDICHPCFVEYDYIGHMETIQTDAEHILRDWGAPPTFKYPAVDTANTTSRIGEYFQELNQEQIDGLYKLFETDFKMFGYEKGLAN